MEALIEYIKASNPGKEPYSRRMWLMAIKNAVGDLVHEEDSKIDRREVKEIMREADEAEYGSPSLANMHRVFMKMHEHGHFISRTTAKKFGAP